MRRLAGLVTVLAMSGLGTVAAQTPATTASAFYMQYRAAFDKATKIEDVLAYMAASNKAEVEATPADQRAKMFEIIKMMNALTGVKVIKETRTADGATLTVEALNSEKEKTTGIVEMVKENGAWKVGKESWSS